MWGPGSCPCFSSSALCCPAGAWGPGARNQACGDPWSWALGLNIPSYPYSWASTCALWAGWPTARLPTPSFSLRQTVVLVRWASSAWAPGRTCQSAGMPIATVCKVQPPPPCLTPWLCPFPLAHQPNPLNPPFPQMWPADAAMALWVMGPACATGSCLMYWLPPPTSPPSMGCAAAQGVWGRGIPGEGACSQPCLPTLPDAAGLC